LAKDNVIRHSVPLQVFLFRSSTPYSGDYISYFMWLRKELGEIKINSLSIRQQLDLLQNNAYVSCNFNNLVQARISFIQLDKSTTPGLSGISRIQREINLVWHNIYLYIATFFPLVWAEIRKINFFPDIQTTFGHQLDLKEQDTRIRIFQNFLEVCRSLVFGGSLRLPFSQDTSLLEIFNNLLCYCQITDIPGKASIAGQRRVIFLQNWIRKLVLRNSLSSFLNSTVPASESPQKVIEPFKQKPNPITASKSYIAKEIHIQSIPIPPFKTEELDQSPLSIETTFSSYLHRQTKHSLPFIGLKLKFDTDESDDNCSTIHSEDSIWKPTFAKRRKL